MKSQNSNGGLKAFEKVILKKTLERYQLQKEQQTQAAECKHARGTWPVLGWA